jgi:hypothetical protein
VGLQRRAGVVDGGGDEEEATACAGAARGGTGGGVGGSGGEEVGEDGLDGVVGAEDVDVDDGFEGIEGEVGDGGEEVACCSGSGGMMVRDLMGALWGRGGGDLHAEIYASQFLDAGFYCFVQTLRAAYVNRTDSENL